MLTIYYIINFGDNYRPHIPTRFIIFFVFKLIITIYANLICSTYTNTVRIIYPKEQKKDIDK